MPAWHTADGSRHRACAHTWTHIATGASGNPAPPPGHTELPLLADYVDGRRTLPDLLRFADAHEVNWLAMHPDPAADATSPGRCRIHRSRGDLYPPHASWLPATVTSPTVVGHRYQALVADGYTTRGGVLARFPAHEAARIAADLGRPDPTDDDGPWVQLFRDTLLILSGATDAHGDPCWIEQDQVAIDADGCYPLGAHHWQWTLAPVD